MSIESILGWIVIVGVLVGLSSVVAIPTCHYLERAWPFWPAKRSVRWFGVALVAVALWYFIPTFVHYGYFHYVYRRN
jgi:hypothetical protein